MAVTGGLMANTAAADPTLPAKTPRQLLTAVAGAHVNGLSGTVTETADLGLPALPTGQGQGPDNSAQFSALLTGTHTIKVWTAGTDRSRIALLGSYGESDLIRNGRDSWLWSSADKKAVHTHYAGVSPTQRRPTEVPSTPQEAAKQALDAVGPTTQVSVARNVTVAGRAAYQLVLRPKDARSLVDRVTIAVDSRTFVPLRVQLTGDGMNHPAFSIGFRSVDFSVPSPDRFTFTPPAGTKVSQHQVTAGDHPSTRQPKAVGKTTTVGTGWTAVAVAPMPQQVTGSSNPQLGRLLTALPRVSGSWGSGRLLTGTVFSAVITDNGRVAVGAVRPELLYQALQK